ncbi:MAG: hypothetical protein ABR985_04655 [Methanotrichaceae archaeon]|jgi:hypothetical protein
MLFENPAIITLPRQEGLICNLPINPHKTAMSLADKLKDRFLDGRIFINLQGTSKNPISPAEAMAQVIHAYRQQTACPRIKMNFVGCTSQY